MYRKATLLTCLLLAVAATGWFVVDTDAGPAMTLGNPDLASIGAITFAPDGNLLVADSYGAAIVAIAVSDTGSGGVGAPTEVTGLDRKIASLLGTKPDRIRIHDMAAHPRSGGVYLSVSRGSGAGEAEVIKSKQPSGSSAHLIRLAPDGGLREVDLERVRFAKTPIPSAFEPSERDRRGNPRRIWTVLELGFADGKVLASGISNEEWGSTMLQIPYPFSGEAEMGHLRIFHTAHGRYETGAPARVFVPYERDGATHLFAGFSCTPLVDFSLDQAKGGRLAEGRTVAELGAGNHVLDMISVARGDKRYILLANHLHPFMLLDLDDVPGAQKLTRPTNRAGIDRHPLAHRHVERLANLGTDRVLLLQRPEGRDGRVDLKTVRVADLLAAS